jgi:hypothetical protein
LTRIIRIAGVLAIAVFCFVASAVPVFSADSGSVAATVTAATPCITVTPASIGFGTAGFSSSAAATVVDASGTMSFTNCSSARQRVFGRGSDATGGGATWDLMTAASPTNPCTVGPNVFQQATFRDAAEVVLTDANTNLIDIDAGTSFTLGGRIRMPCAASSGAGNTMSFSFVYTATFAP